ncbi:MAG: alpha/beta fold hydrolase [Proteobacteria bacterium]|nr:alpha/beta fold hydrolase [Pseudomonadota bacterium]MDE3208577.1 alpha/beta fold hydrolase [Pseudomonadota bacterium]
MGTIELQGDERAVLLLHGLSSSPLEMLPVAQSLNKAGFSVRSPFIPGYGYESGAKITNWLDWQTFTLDCFDRMQNEYETVAVCGLCMGAVLALNLAIERPQLVSALSVLSTTLYFDGWATPWSRMLLPLAFYSPLRYILSVREREPYGVKNPHIRAWVAKEMQSRQTSVAGASRLPMKGIYEASRLMKKARSRIHEIESPVLIIHADEDDVASVRSAEFVAGHVASPMVRKIIVHNSYHMVTLDNDRNQVMQETTAFFKENMQKSCVEVRTGHQQA